MAYGQLVAIMNFLTPKIILTASHFVFKPGTPTCGRYTPGFLKLFLCGRLYGCVFVCVSTPRLLITSGATWTPYDWLNKGYSFYMAAVVVIGDGHGLRIEKHRAS